MKQLAAHLYKTMPSVLPKNEAELLAVRQSDAVSNKRAKSNSSVGYDPTRAEITVQERHTHSHPPLTHTLTDNEYRWEGPHETKHSHLWGLGAW